MFFANGDTHLTCFQAWVGFGLNGMPAKRFEAALGLKKGWRFA